VVLNPILLTLTPDQGRKKCHKFTGKNVSSYMRAANDS